MPSISDKDFSLDWVAKAQTGDKSAQKAIYLHFAPQVYRLARHILQCEATAEEVLQDCFVDVICKIHSFKHQGSFAGWLRQIAVNHCLMVLRSSWVKKRSDLNESNSFDPDEREDKGESDHRAAKQMNQALAKLPAPTRAVLWLYDVEGYTHVEIAKMMGKSKSFSKSQLARGHEKLRNQLSGQHADTEADTEEDSFNSSDKHCSKKNLTPNVGGDSCTPLLNNC